MLHYFILEPLSFPTSSNVHMFSLSHVYYQKSITTISLYALIIIFFHTSSFHGTKRFTYLIVKNQNKTVK